MKLNVNLEMELKKNDGLRFRSIPIGENESMVFDKWGNTAIKTDKSGSYEVFTYEWVKLPFMEGEHLALRKYEN